MYAGVHEQIDANYLVDSRDTQALDTLHDFEEEEAETHHPCGQCYSSDQLDLQLFMTAGIYQACISVENADRQDTPKANKAMHLRSLDWVVYHEFAHKFTRNYVY